MSFNPTVSVISRQAATIGEPDLSLPSFLERFPCLSDAEAVTVTGSIIAGWGNAYSDIDLYAFADRELQLPDDPSTESWVTEPMTDIELVHWTGSYQDTRVDLQVWPVDAARVALAPFAGDEPEFFEGGHFVEDFIYRLWIGQTLINEPFFEEIRATIGNSGYRRALARTLKSSAECCLIDLAGQLQAGDVMTARLSAMDAAATVADCCLVMAGELCRKKKWLLRRIEVTPSCGIDLGEYRALVLGGPAEGEAEAAYVERVARWAQSHIVRIEDDVLT